MTFTEFLQKKYPLWEGKDLSEFHPPASQMVRDAEEWAAVTFGNVANFHEFWHSTNTLDEGNKVDIQRKD